MNNFNLKLLSLQQKLRERYPIKTFDVNRIANDLYPTKIPLDATIGKFTIKNEIMPKNKPITIVSLRDAYLWNFKPLKVVFSDDYILAKLVHKKKGTMMSTHPQELFQMHVGIDNAHGDVLIGGLGLGYVVLKIAEKKNVKSVTVVELRKEVVDLISPYMKNKKIRIVNDDIYNFIKETNLTFDYCYFDIHYGTGENTYIDTIIPLRISAHQHLKGKFKIYCWAEEIMIGQIEQTLAAAHFLSLKESKRYVIYHAFKLGETGSDVIKNIDEFLSNVGSKTWLKRWKWFEINNK